MKKVLLILTLAFIIAFLVPGIEVLQSDNVVAGDPLPSVEELNHPAEVTSPALELGDDGEVLLGVPFFIQAPSGNWSDPRLQDGCEEASILMAYLWATDKTTTLLEAEVEIIAISEYEEASTGNFYDTSARDTAQLMRDYFGYTQVRTEKDIATDDIKTELSRGNLVIVPVNGQRLGNPYYTEPGPVTHMLVIRGYDSIRGEFVTNDVGTRQGEGFRYSETVLSAALQDYRTGYHEPQVPGDTAMIVVAK